MPRGSEQKTEENDSILPKRTFGLTNVTVPCRQERDCRTNQAVDGRTTETFVSSGGDFGFYFLNMSGEFWWNLTLIINKL